MPEVPRADHHRRALAFIEDVTANADKVQRHVLSEILSQNSGVEYLRRHGMSTDSADIDSFRRRLPVVTYEDIQPDILRIANGDKSPILSGKPITEFLTSSGTSGGERKLMPTIDDELDRRQMLYNLLMPVISQYVPGLDKGKAMYLLFTKSEARTPGGLLARPVLTSYYKSRHFLCPATDEDPHNMYTSPKEAVLCTDSYQSMYTQLLCGLLQRTHVLRVGAVFASGFIRAIRFLEKHWPSLCRDIRAGVLDPEITDRSVREAIGRVLVKPEPELAGMIEAECRGESWKGIIARLWPNTKYVDVIVTGAMAMYIPTLDYYTGGLPLACTMYASSECYFGLNLEPMCKPSDVKYTLVPSMAYFEFLPVESHNNITNGGGKEPDKRELVDLVDVQLGKEYELVVTTYAGLYRYRVGDVLRVAGFKNKAPQFSFIRRKNVVLSIDSDKTDEVELHAAVGSAISHLAPFGASLVEYTSQADTSTIPGHYVLYWELRKGSTLQVPASVFEDCCLAVEESLNSVYRQGRASDGSIGPLEIRVVEEGTFDKLMDYALSQGASINQYKAPRCVKAGGAAVELLDGRVAARFFSPKCPRWAPGNKHWAKDQHGHEAAAKIEPLERPLRC